MISKIVSGILEKALSDYIELDSKALNISLLKGNVKLHDLRVKTFALDHIYKDVPFVISKGNLSNLKLIIPWKNLSGEAVECEIDGLDITLKPKKEFKWDEKKEREKEQDIKISHLEKYEMQKKLVESFVSEQKEKEKQNDNNTKKKNKKKKGKKKKKIPIFDALLETVINNIKVNVKNVCVKYEDGLNNDRKFELTLIVKHVQFMSTDENWETAFHKVVSDITHKMVILNQFSIDMKVNDAPKRFLFAPLDGELKLKMQRLSRMIDLTKPLLQGGLNLKDIEISLSEMQYKCFLSLVDYVGSFTKFEKYRRYRPVGERKTPKMWWKFVYNSVLHGKRKRYTVPQLFQAINDRYRYIELYKKFLKSKKDNDGKWKWIKKITPEEKKEMKRLQEKINLKTLLMYRDMGRLELERENEKYLELKKERDLESSIEKKKSNKNLLKSLQKSLKKKKKISVDDIILSKKEKNELYKTGLQKLTDDFDLGLNNLKEVNKKQPVLVQFMMKVNLDDLRVSLTNERLNEKITSVHFGKFDANVVLEKGGFNIAMNMNNFEIRDGGKNCIFKRIVFPSHAKKLAIKAPETEKNGDKKEVSDTEKPKTDAPVKEANLVDLVVSKKKNLIGIKLDLQEISLVYNLDLIKRIVSFFVVDEIPNVENFEMIDQIKEQSSKKSSAPKKEKKVVENEELSEATQIQIEVNAKAPMIYVPARTDTFKTDYLLLDLGVIEFNKKPSSEKFIIKLNNLEITMPRNTPIFQPVITTKETELQEKLLKRINLELSMKKTADGMDINLEERKNIQFLVSPEKVSFLLSILNQLISFTENPFEEHRLITGEFEVKGPYFEEFEDSAPFLPFHVEMNTTLRQLSLCDIKDNKPKKLLKLGNGVELENSRDSSFVLSFFQSDGRRFKFKFNAKELKTKTTFVDRIEDVLLKVLTKHRKQRKKKEMEKTRKEQKKKGEFSFEKKEKEPEKKKFVINMNGKFNNIIMSILSSSSQEKIFEFRIVEFMFNFNNKNNNAILMKFPYLQMRDSFNKSIGILNEMNINLDVEKKVNMLINFKSVNVDVKNKMLKDLMAVGYDILKTIDKLDFDKKRFSQDTKKEDANTTPVNLEIELGKINVNLYSMFEEIEEDKTTLTPKKVLALFLDKSKVAINLGNEDIVVYCSFRNISIQNSLMDSEKTSIYENVLENRNEDSQNLVQLQIKVLKFAKAFEYKIFFDLDVKNVKYVHIQKVLLNLIDYGIPLARELIYQENERLRSRKEMNPKYSQPPTHFFKVKIGVHDIDVFLPISAKEKNGFLLKCGKFEIKNEVLEETKKIVNRFSIFGEKIDVLQSTEVVTSLLNKPIQFNLIANVAESQLNREFKYPGAEILISLPDVIQLSISSAQVEMFINIFIMNVLAGTSFGLQKELTVPKVLIELSKAFVNKISLLKVPKEFIKAKMNINFERLQLNLLDKENTGIMEVFINGFIMNLISRENKSLDLNVAVGAVRANNLGNRGYEKSALNKVSKCYESLISSSADFKISQKVLVDLNKNEVEIKIGVKKPKICVTNLILFELFKFATEVKIIDSLKRIEVQKKEKEKVFFINELKENSSSPQQKKVVKEEEKKNDVSICIEYRMNDAQAMIVENQTSENSRILDFSIPEVFVGFNFFQKEQKMKAEFKLLGLKAGVVYGYESKIFKSIVLPIKGDGSVSIDLDKKPENENIDKLIEIIINGFVVTNYGKNEEGIKKSVSLSYNDMKLVYFIAMGYMNEFKDNYMKYLPKVEDLKQIELEKVKEIAKDNYEKGKELYNKSKDDAKKKIKEVLKKVEEMGESNEMKVIKEEEKNEEKKFQKTIVEAPKKAVNTAIKVVSQLGTNDLYAELIDDSEGFKIPLFSLSLIDLMNKIIVEYSSLGKDVSMSMTNTFSVYLDYLNYKRNVFEPILEKCSSPLQFNMRLSNKTVSMEFHSKDRINVNVTQDMIENLVSTLDTWLTNKDQVVTTDLNLKSFGIVNTAGVDCSFWTDETEEQELKTREKVEFNVENFLSNNNWVFLKLKKTQRVIRVLISREQSFEMLNPQPVSKAPFEKKLFVSIDIIKGQKVININTGKCITNNSNVDYRLSITPEKGEPVEALVKVGESFHLSYAMLRGAFTFKPEPVKEESQKQEEDEYNFLKTQTNLSQLMSLPNKKVIQKMFISRKTKRANFVTLSIDRNNEKLTHLRIKTPLAVQNLLPHDIEVKLFHSRSVGVEYCKFLVKEGEKHFCFEADIDKELYMSLDVVDSQWKNKKKDEKESKEGRIRIHNGKLETSYNLYDNRDKKLQLKVEYNDLNNECLKMISIYVKNWVINQTGINNCFLDYSGRIGYSEVAGQRFKKKALKGQKEILMTQHEILNCRIGEYASKSFDIKVPGSSTDIVVGNHHFGIFVDIGPGKYKKTKIVFVTPRYIISNKTGEEIQMRQYDTVSRKPTVFKVDDSGSFYWRDKKAPMLFQFKVGECQWSKYFKLDNMTQILTVLKKVKEEYDSDKGYVDLIEEKVPILIDIQQKKGMIFVQFSKSKHPPFYIDNRSSHKVAVSQRGQPEWEVVSPRKFETEKELKKVNDLHRYSLPLFYGDKVMCIQIGDKSANVNLNKFNRETVVTYRNVDHYIYVTALNRSKRIIITRNRRVKADGKAAKDGMITEIEKPKDCFFQFYFIINSIGVSLVNSKPEEIIYFTVKDLTFSVQLNKQSVFVKALVKKIQCDNQLSDGLFPIMVCTGTEEKEKDRNFLDLYLILSYKEKGGFIYIPYFSFCMQQATIATDVLTIEQILMFGEILGAMTKNFGSNDDAKLDKVLAYSTKGKKDNVATESIAMLPYLHFDIFEIHPIKIKLTFNMSSSGDDQALMNKTLVLNLLQSVGAGLNTNIEDVVIFLRSFILKYPFLSIMNLVKGIALHYTQNVVREVYKIVGSLDFLGNPAGMLQDVGEGFYGLVYEPINGFSSFEGFISGIGKGAGGLVKHTIHGTFNMTSKLAAGLGDGVSYLSFDQEYISERKKKRVQKKAKNVFHGIGLGVQEGFGGVFDGVKGVVTKPIEGAKKGGAIGLIKGVGQGILGVPTKPIAATMDLGSRVFEGIKNTAISKQEIQKIRKPRVFGDFGALIPFDTKKARAQDILHSIESKKFENETYILHVNLEKYVLILTKKKIIYIEISKKDNRFSFHYIYENNFTDFTMKGSEIGKDEIKLKLKKPIKQGFLKGDVKERKIIARDTNQFMELINVFKLIFEKEKDFTYQ